MCTAEQFEKWRNGDTLYDEWSGKFVECHELTENQKAAAMQEYEDTKDEFQRDWKDLSEKAREKYYEKYAEIHDLFNTDNELTYDQYMHNTDLETFIEKYTTPNGETIVAFGKYGYN